MVLAVKYRPARKRKEYALVSKTNGRTLYWFGTRKPSQAKLLAQERRIQFFENVSAHKRKSKRGKPYWVKGHKRRK